MPDETAPTVDTPLTQRELQLLIGLVNRELHPQNTAKYLFTDEEKEKLEGLDEVLGSAYHVLYHGLNLNDAKLCLEQRRHD